MEKKHPFKINFDIDRYRKIFPKDIPNENEIINFGKPIEEQYWTRQVPEYLHKDFLELEEKRWIQGAWIYIKGLLLWLPPQYYSFLNWGAVINVESPYPQFRLRKLKEYYFKEECRRNPACIGSFIMKSRRDGTTVTCMWDALWEMRKGLHKIGAIGIQSMTKEDAINPCYTALISHYNNLPEEILNIFYPERPRFTKLKLEFISSGKDGRRMVAKPYAGEVHAMDGKEMVLMFFDEVCKLSYSLTDTIEINTQFILEGVMRKGLFVLFSSPSIYDGQSNKEAMELWDRSDPDDLQANGTTKSRIHRFHSNPLDGITGMFDIYGDADPDEVYKEIMLGRENAPANKKLERIRAFPLNRDEMFNTTETKTKWSNNLGLLKRKDFLYNTIYKNELTKEPKWMWGNLEWENGVEFSKLLWRPNKENKHCLDTGRICLSEFPNFNEPLTSYFKPPRFVDGVIGYDPKHKQDTTRKGSNHAFCALKFREGVVDKYPLRPIAIYDCEPKFIYTAFDDLIKLMLFLKMPVQYEGSSDEFERYVESKGLFDWLLFKTGSKKQKGELVKGSAFVNIMQSIDIITNVPINPNDDYILENWWFEQLIEQILDFDEDNHQPYDLFMALVQAVFGMFKILSSQKRTSSKLGADIISYILG